MRALAALFFILALFSVRAEAQEFLYVYPAETPEQGVTEVQLWLQQMNSSDQETYYKNNAQTRGGFGLYSLEVEHGLSPQLSLAGYVDFLQAPGDSPMQSQLRGEIRYRLGNPGDSFFNKMLYFEYDIPYAGYFEEYERLETKLILEKQVGDFDYVLNPTFSKNTAGRVQRGLEAGFSGGAYWIRHAAFQPGLEYYAEYGQIAALNSWSQTREQIGAVLRSHLNDTWSLQLTVAGGLNSSTDRLVSQLVLTWEPPPHSHL